MSSRPAEMRTSPSVMPSACVSAGTEHGSSWPDGRSGFRRRRGSPRGPSAGRCSAPSARSSEPSSNASMPPKPRICRLASACCGWEAGPGSRRVGPSGAPARIFGQRQAVGAVLRSSASAASWCRAGPARNRTGSRIAPAAFCTNFSHSMSSSRVATTTPPTLSLWPLRYFVVLCDHEIGAEFDRPLDVRAGEGVVDDQPRRRGDARDRPPRGRSVSRITGLLGVSTNSMRVAGVNAARRRLEIRRCRRR